MNADERRCSPGGLSAARGRIRVYLRASAAILLACGACLGCVARTLTVESDPPGAALRVNGDEIGVTPATVAFRHYGIYGIELRKDGFETLRAEERVMPRWYARFPLGLVSELLWPGVIHDDRYLSYELVRPTVPDRVELVKRAEEARGGAPGPE